MILGGCPLTRNYKFDVYRAPIPQLDNKPRSGIAFRYLGPYPIQEERFQNSNLEPKIFWQLVSCLNLTLNLIF